MCLSCVSVWGAVCLGAVCVCLGGWRCSAYLQYTPQRHEPQRHLSDTYSVQQRTRCRFLPVSGHPLSHVSVPVRPRSTAASTAAFAAAWSLTAR